MDSAAQIAELGKFTSGWVARYEIWDIEHDIRLVNRYDIPLEEAEVTLQIQQFRAFTWTVHKCREKKLQLRFPTSISSSINILSILRTVYLLDRGAKEGSEGSSWRFTTLPVNLLKPQNSSTGEFSEGGIKTSSPRLGYEYSLQFSESQRHILYRDALGMDILPYGGPSISTAIAVFELNITASSFSSHLVGHVQKGGALGYFGSCAFHPTLPILVFYACSTGSGTAGIELWAFDTSKLLPCHLVTSAR